MSQRLIDTHCHFFEHGFEGSSGILFPGRDEEIHAYERYRAEFGIERALAIGFEGESAYAGNNEYLHGLAADRPWLVPVPFVAVGGSIRGSRAASAYLQTAEDARWFASALHQGDAPALVSLNARPEALAELGSAIRAAEGTWFLVSHLGLPGPAPARDAVPQRLNPLLQLAEYAHVTVKLSGQYAASSSGYPHPDVQVIVDAVADAFGPSRLTWGSDFSPVLEHNSFGQSIDCVLPSGVSAAEADAILFGTAARLIDHYLGVTA